MIVVAQWEEFSTGTDLTHVPFFLAVLIFSDKGMPIQYMKVLTIWYCRGTTHRYSLVPGTVLGRGPMVISN